MVIIHTFFTFHKVQLAVPVSLSSQKTTTCWDECLPSCNPLKEHDYLCAQTDANAQKVAEDNPKPIEIMRELQEKVTSLEKRQFKANRDRLLWRTFRQVKSYAAFTPVFLIMGLSKPCLSKFFKRCSCYQKELVRKRNCQQESFFWQISKSGQDSKLTLEEEFLIVMMRLKVGLFQKDLVHRFGISEATVSRLFTSRINLMYL